MDIYHVWLGGFGNEKKIISICGLSECWLCKWKIRNENFFFLLVYGLFEILGVLCFVGWFFFLLHLFLWFELKEKEKMRDFFNWMWNNQWLVGDEDKDLIDVEEENAT